MTNPAPKVHLARSGGGPVCSLPQATATTRERAHVTCGVCRRIDALGR